VTGNGGRTTCPTPTQRELPNRLQAIVSRQGEPITDLDEIRGRLEHLTSTMEAPPECPEDWGAVRVSPQTVELWSEADDRLHDRLLYERDGMGWSMTRLAP
jgi:pyridoxine/pyridoxamine 5'-phosphate oxidase